MIHFQPFNRSLKTFSNLSTRTARNSHDEVWLKFPWKTTWQFLLVNVHIFRSFGGLHFLQSNNFYFHLLIKNWIMIIETTHPQYSFEIIPLVTRCMVTFVTIMKVPNNLVLCCKRDNFYKLDSKIINNTWSVLRNLKILCFSVSVSFFIPRFSYTHLLFLHVLLALTSFAK